jgi:hypothetical protein
MSKASAAHCSAKSAGEVEGDGFGEGRLAGAS